jgi:predicted phosphodiesterase
MHYIGSIDAMRHRAIIQNNKSSVEFHAHCSANDVLASGHLHSNT